jgi:UDP-N-acetylmuramoyl-tripeptide--D-alanyl-D-alanine ligase
LIPLELSRLEQLGRLEVAPWADAVTGVQIDSRRIEEGDLFVAVGPGRDFVKHAFARGAAAALLPEDAFAALAAIGGAVRDRSSARVVGITGSTGKTSTKDILAALCARHARTVASEASFNNELGVPLTLCRLEPDTEVCIVEMGMRGLGQIAELSRIARPDVAVITKVGPVHLELLGTLENVARSKAEIVDALPPGGIAIVPDDAPELEPFLRRDEVEVRRFGQPRSWDADERGARGTFEVGDRTVTVAVNLAARHQARNVLAALHAADALGLPLADCELEVTLSRWRGEEHELAGGGLLVNDSYNANPLSMRAALEHLADRAGARRRIAVLGDMAELGPDAPEFHREIGRAAAELGVAELVAVGELARGYVEGAEGVPAHWAATAEEAVELVRTVLRPGDAVLVKASRAVGLEAVAENLVE